MYLIDRLDNGIRVVMEKIPYINSVSIGIIIDCGSKNENRDNNGTTHFIEHMLFKGTKERDAKMIAESIDNIGGVLNAFTSKETTMYYAKVLNNHIEVAMDILSDMIGNSLFNEEDIEKEKSVILEELYMYQDSPEDLTVELLNEMMFEGTSLEYPVIGTEETIKSIKREDILNYFSNNYIPENMIISIAGNIDERESLKQLKHYFGSFKNYKLKSTDVNNPRIDYSFTNKLDIIIKDTEQINLCIGMEGLPVISPKMEALMILNNIFGGSMSSRLFQKIREDLGLAYTIETFPSSFKDTGILNLFLSLHPSQVVKSIQAINDEINHIKKNLISKDELKKAKEQLKGNYVLGMENTFNRMYEIGKSLLIFDRVFSQEEIINKIDSITMEGIGEVNNIIFNRKKFNIALVGKADTINEDKIKQILFQWGDLMMNVKVVNKSRFDLPRYETDGSAGLDLQANIEEPITLKPLERALIPTGLYISMPKGYEAQIRGRSGLALKHGITLANGIGTIDSDYRGEIKVILINLGNEPYNVKEGDRIAQMVFMKYEKAELEIVNELDETKRGKGGFGHSGY